MHFAKVWKFHCEYKIRNRPQVARKKLKAFDSFTEFSLTGMSAILVKWIHFHLSSSTCLTEWIIYLFCEYETHSFTIPITCQTFHSVLLASGGSSNDSFQMSLTCVGGKRT